MRSGDNEDRRSIWRDIINRQLPSATLKGRNALFEWQLTRLRWPYFPRRRNSHYFVQAKLDRLAQYTLNRGCLWPALFALLVVGMVFAEHYLSYLLFFAVIADVLYSLLSNLSYALTTINTISPQIVTAQWEPLRLTMLTDTDILQANHATIQILSWRAMMRDVSIRAFVGIAGILLLIYSLTLPQPSEFDSARTFYLVLIVMACTGLVGLVLEPLWRMRTVTLIALTLTTWINNYGITIVVTLAAVLAFLIVELIVVLALSWLALTIVTTIVFQRSLDPHTSDILTFILFPLGTALVITGLYLSFKGLDAACFWQLKRVAFRG